MTQTQPVMRDRIDSLAGTVADAVDWCMQRGLDPADVRITACHVKWQSPETEREAEYRREWQASNEKRTEEWERTTYERLRAKFEKESS